MCPASRHRWPVAALAMVVIAGVGLALWTAVPIGGGDAQPGGPLRVRQTSTITALAPGSRPQPLRGVFDNPHQKPIYVTQVSAAVTRVNDASGNPASGCDASDFTIAGTGLVNRAVPPGTGVGSWGNLTIAFNDQPGHNQDGCKNVRLVISYTAR